MDSTNTVNVMSSHALLDTSCSFRLWTDQEDPDRGPLRENSNLSVSEKIIILDLGGKQQVEKICEDYPDLSRNVDRILHVVWH